MTSPCEPVLFLAKTKIHNGPPHMPSWVILQDQLAERGERQAWTDKGTNKQTGGVKPMSGKDRDPERNKERERDI